MTASEIESESDFVIPDMPESIPQWAHNEAKPWQRLSEFDILVRAEEISGQSVELAYVNLPLSVWGIHVVRGDRARLCINQALPPMWRRFALFHELYHLIAHPRSESFWGQTFTPLSRFEWEADTFAWGAILPEWKNREYED